MEDNLASYGPAGAALRTAAAARTYLGRIYIGMFDAHLANSAYTAAELHGAMCAPHRRPVHVCLMGVHLPRPSQQASVAHLRRVLAVRWDGGDATVLLYAGRLSPEKQVATRAGVIAALAGRTPPVRLVIAGDGSLRSTLQARCAAAAPGRCHFLGHVAERVALDELIAASDAFLYPNPHEPFGIGPLEAMAAGTPVVAAASGDLLSYATADNAWLSEPTADALATAIGSLLDQPDERLRRITNGRRTAERFEWPAAASRMFRLYEALHGAGSRGASAEKIGLSARHPMGTLSYAKFTRGHGRMPYLRANRHGNVQTCAPVYTLFTSPGRLLKYKSGSSCLVSRRDHQMFVKELTHAGHVRRFIISDAVPEGWEMRVEQDSAIVRRVRYTDWHRVERALSNLVREVSDLEDCGWTPRTERC